jgi:hypothetical protein
MNVLNKINRVTTVGVVILFSLPLLGGCQVADKKLTIADASDTVTITPAQSAELRREAKPEVVSCMLNEQKDVRRAVNEATRLLDHKQCWTDSEVLFRDLLSIAASNRPVPENRKVIGRFIHAMGRKGLMTEAEKEEFGRRFFSPRFTSVIASDIVKRKSMNICSICKQGMSDQVIDEVYSELKDKKIGLLEACDLNVEYQRATDNADEVIVLLEAACRACSK